MLLESDFKETESELKSSGIDVSLNSQDKVLMNVSYQLKNGFVETSSDYYLSVISELRKYVESQKGQHFLFQ